MQIAIGYEFHKNCFDLWLAVYGMSMKNAQKSLEYTQNLFTWSKYWTTVKQRELWKSWNTSNFEDWGLTLVAYKKCIGDITRFFL